VQVDKASKSLGNQDQQLIREFLMGTIRMNRNSWKASRLLAAAVLGTAGVWCSVPAWAANASDLNISMTAIPTDAVSVSRQNLNTYVAYHVTLGNTGGNTINQVTMTGAAATDGATQAAFNSVVSIGGIVPTCGPTGATTITCTVGQMKAGAGSEFFLLFQTPTDGQNMTFTLQTTFSEGNSPNSPPANIVGATQFDTVGLITQTNPQINAHVQTVLPPVDGSFFTGPNGAVSSDNPFSTTVSLKKVNGLVTTDSIDLASATSYLCDANVPSYYCYGLTSTINVDNAKDDSKVYYGSGQAIAIVLRQDISSLNNKKPVPKIGDVRLYYNSDPDNIPGIGSLVPACGAGLPAVNQPCVSGRTSFVKGQKGYYQYEIQALDNGKFSW
jgi:hypothetical protein